MRPSAEGAPAAVEPAGEATTNYVAAWADRAAGTVLVLERDVRTGQRLLREWPAPCYFYVPAPDGPYVSIFGDRLKRLDFGSEAELQAALPRHPRRFESDVAPLDRVLMDNYYGRPVPPLHTALFDIEVAYTQAVGFASPANPYAPVNAVTVYQAWLNRFLTLAVPPSGWAGEPPAELTVNGAVKLCRTELELLVGFLDAIRDADVVSGWNSEFFDVPYLVKRIELVLGREALRGLGHHKAPLPAERLVERFGGDELTYVIKGKNHLDYLRLFKKFTFEGRTSYSLASIASEELAIPKLSYSGTLEQLYTQDFERFLLYNRRDVELLQQLDGKFKFIALVNQMAHENTVTPEAILGTVKYVETGIMNHAHHQLGRIVNDKVITQNPKIEGAVVLTPKVGLHEWVGSVDVNSLYPNVIRSLNASSEMIVGQFTNPHDEHDWLALLEERAEPLTFLPQGSAEPITLPAKEWKAVLAEHRWAVSAYGTVFSQANGPGLVPTVLGYWYSERKRLQAEKKRYAQLARELPPGAEQAEARRLEEHYDLLQLTKKISMNSLYGALLNDAFRFGDVRLGASVTATGRRLTQFMMESIGEHLTGTRHPLVKRRTEAKDGTVQVDYEIASPAVLYGDTDSVYYKTFASTKEEAVAVADGVAAALNAKFPGFMRAAFNCQPGFDGFIRVSREVVGSRGLFQTKKKYVIKVVDQEGTAVNKLKTQGSEIKKADTPKVIQEFLKATIDLLLNGASYDEVAAFVNAQRQQLLRSPEHAFSLGVAKQVNNLDAAWAAYRQHERAGRGRLNLPGHVRAAINYNELLEEVEPGARPLRSGDKVLLFYLKPNERGYTSIAFPAELPDFPAWFLARFQVDLAKTEEKMIDSKLEGIFAAIGREVPTPQTVLFNSLVSF